jgi:hypothetical protein
MVRFWVLGYSSHEPGENSLTHPKLTHLQVPIQKIQNGIFWMLRSWVLGYSSPEPGV